MIDETHQLRLQTQSDIIRQLATPDAQGELPRIRFDGGGNHSREWLKSRIDKLKETGLLHATQWPKAQAKVAALHGLVYLSGGARNRNNRNRWIYPTTANPQEGFQIAADEGRNGIQPTRADTYLYNILEDPLRVSIPAVDLALIAHSCGLPVESLLDPRAGYLKLSGLDVPRRLDSDDPLFDSHLDWTLSDYKNLFSQDESFLTQFAEPDEGTLQLEIYDRMGHLRLRPGPQSAFAPGLRIGMHDPRDHNLTPPDIYTNEEVTLCLRTPKFKFGVNESAELLVLEQDANGVVYLVSSGIEMKNRLDVTPAELAEEEIRIPRSQKRDGTPRRLPFEVPGRSRLLALFLKKKGQSKLESLELFQRTTSAYQEQHDDIDIKLRQSDFKPLRQLLLLSPRDSWQLIRKDLQVAAPANP